MARGRARLSKAITLRMLRPYLPFAPGAYAAFDFTTNEALFAGVRSELASVPNWTFTRASTGYALDNAGRLIPFVSGALRRTDRGVLIEGARTNALVNSNDFTNGTYWSLLNASGAATTAPDGTNTATSITVTATGSTNTNASTGNRVAISGTNCVASIYVKRGANIDATSNFFLRDSTAASNKISATLTWATMAVSGTGASIERLGSSDWYRIILIDTAWTSGNSAHLYIGATGESRTAGHNWIVWGAQIEAASFASSYIPTTTASVTRAADALSITGVSGLTYPMTLFAEFERLTDTGGTEILLQVDAGGSTDRVVVSVETTDKFDVAVTAGGAVQGSSQPNVTLAAGSVIRRGSGRVNTNSIRACLAGTLGSEDTSVTLPATPSAIRIGTNHSAAGQPFNYLRRISLVSGIAFDDAQLQAQTL